MSLKASNNKLSYDIITYWKKSCKLFLSYEMVSSVLELQ